MASEESAHFADRFTAIFNDPDLAIADEIFAPSFRAHLPLAPELDRDGWKGFVNFFRSGFPDLRMTLEDTVDAGDKIVLRVTYHGTHTGEFQGVAPTGRNVMLKGIGIFEMQDGKAVENWAEMDVLGLMQQIGDNHASGEGS